MRAAGFFAALLLAGHAGATGLSFALKDWELACDNTGTCRAAGYQPQAGDAPPVSVLLTRAAGAGTAVTGRLRLGIYDEDASKTTPTEVVMAIDGRGLGRVRLKGGEGELSPTQVAALLERVTQRADIVFGAGNRAWRVSDQGAAAMLLKMDEAQGRLGSVGALVRRGAGGEDTVRRPAPVPVLQAAAVVAGPPVDVALVARMRPLLAASGHGCVADEPALDEPLAWRLDARRVLVSVSCGLGAYNAPRGFWVAQDKPPYQPQLVTAAATEYDESGTISAAFKGRGLGDCWSLDVWVWDGRQFVHTASSTTGQCRLVAPGGTWSLPTRITQVGKPSKNPIERKSQ